MACVISEQKASDDGHEHYRGKVLIAQLVLIFRIDNYFLYLRNQSQD